MLARKLGMQVTPLSPTIGALVEGFQLSAPLDDADQQVITRALLKHHVLFFRDQALTPTEHKSFAARFGALHIHPIYPKHPEALEIIVLDSDLVDLTDNAIWHTDVTFTRAPPMGGVLIARLLPPSGGDTLWSSSSAAYDALSPAMQQFLLPLTATHDIVQSFPETRFGLSGEARERLEAAKHNNPPVVHPVIRTHPATGQRGLFVQEGFTTHINELSPGESRSVLQFLFQHSTRPEFTVRWRWRVNDVAFWDNRCTQHYAIDDYKPARRVMNRATIIGDVPR